MKSSMPKVASKTNGSIDAELVNGLKNNASESQSEDAQASDGNSPLFDTKDLREIISFQKGNFVQHWHPPTNTNYHAIFW